MQILDKISFAPDLAALRRQAHIDAGDDLAAEFDDLARQAIAVARPKAVYREVFVDARGSDTVTMGGVTFRSRVMRMNLDRVERVFAFVATCGTEMDAAIPVAGDPLKEFWLDAVKMCALGEARVALTEHFKTRYALQKSAMMNPGSGDAEVWPIEEQKPLFALIGDVRAAAGVVLTPSFLMTPNKTISGICYATEVDFKTCQLCHRTECPSRAAPFNEVLWATVHGK